MKNLISIMCIPVLVIGCIIPKVSPLPKAQITVVDNIIYSSGKPFAELRYFKADTTNITTPLSETTRVAGLVIYYYLNEKEVWIHPKQGLTLHRGDVEYTEIEDMNREWAAFLQERESRAKQVRYASMYIGGKRMGKEDWIRSVVFGVKISADGKYVSYKTQGMIFDSSHRYLVEYGTPD